MQYSWIAGGGGMSYIGIVDTQAVSYIVSFFFFLFFLSRFL